MIKKKYNKYKAKYISLKNSKNKIAPKIINGVITSNYYIKGIKSFSQYNIKFADIKKKKRLITIVGEFHNLNLLDQYINTTSISEYIKNIIDINKKTYILLELNPKKKLDQINLNNVISINMREIINILKSNNLDNNYIGFDARKIIINSRDLYYNTEKMTIDIFIDNYINKFDEYLKLIEKEITINNYEESHYKFLKKMEKDIIDNVNYIKSSEIIKYIEYVKSNDIIPFKISPTIGNLLTIINKRKDNYYFYFNKDIEKDNFIVMVRQIYMKFSDLYLMSYLFNKNIDTDNIIVVCGNNHAYNYSVILSDLKVYENWNDDWWKRNYKH